MRAGHVARRQDEPVRAAGQRLEQIAEDVPQAGEALERPELEDFVQQERAGPAAGRARGVEKDQQDVERLARGGRLVIGGVPRERRG